MKFRVSLIFIFFFLIISDIRSQIIDAEKEQEIKIYVRGFLGLLAKYSGCQGEKYLSLQAQIIDMHDSYDTRDIMFNDLFTTKTNYKESDIFYTWQQYLDKLKYYFNNNIEVYYDYDNIIVLRNCIITDPVTRNNYAYVTVGKKLVYKQQDYSYTALISVNLSNNNKIAEASTPSEFLSNCNFNDHGNQNDEKEKKLIVLKAIADDYFSKKDYINAKAYYQSLQSKLPMEEAEIVSKISECKQMITTQSLLDKAQNFYNENKFEDARKIYYDLIGNNNANLSFVEKQLRLCNDAIEERKYNQNKELADYYFSIANYNLSNQYYQKALEIKPGDTYTLDQIQKVKKHDYSFVQSEITRAEELTNPKHKKYAEAFEIESEYELSGLLKTDNYYFLTEMMLRAKGDVKKIMHYTSDDCDTYLCIYVLKLKKKLETETNQASINDANFLIQEVINQKFQKTR